MNALPALSIGDLAMIEDEPRVRDADLAIRLGFDRPRDIRKLIERNLAEIGSHGTVRQRGAHIEGGNGAVQYTQEYLLNEAQALLVCMFARTAKAAEVRGQVIAVFLDWRRGDLNRPKPARALNQTEELLRKWFFEEVLPSLARTGQFSVPHAGAEAAVLDPWAALGARMRVIEQAIGLAELAGDDQGQASPGYAAAVAYLPIWPNNSFRRPKWWYDREVRAAAIALHRQVTLDQAIAAMGSQFGAVRAPSRTSLARFWKRLDQARTPHLAASKGSR